DDQLAVLLESTAAIHSASDEKHLAELLIDASLRGTGMANAAFLRPVDQAGRVQVVAARYAAGPAAETHPTFSRSLLAAASTGQVAEIQSVGGDIAQSIVAMNITAALCVPIVLGARGDAGGTIAGYLYLDSRGTHAPRPRPNAAPFCVALGRMASLALANLKRIEVERRQALMEAELHAAAATQRWILPQRRQTIDRVECIGESRPGRYIGGDFFDIIDLGHGRLAVALGDVAGKGAAAAVLMTATQGFLHACLREHGDVQRAVDATNRFVSARTPEARFVTAWVGVLDLRRACITYIDAGHGYAMIQSDAGEPVDLRGGEGVPIGIDANFRYAAVTAPLPERGRILVVSDGVIEQTGIVQQTDGTLSHEQYGIEAVRSVLQQSPPDADTVADLFSAVVHHAGTSQLADDATAVLVRW
ncbi:MAG: serine/threonine-protein phosphatase, partial [Phycisphaerae bacterium]|nr:serine/threonine-protein phosphatase [Phycisphaerae bacterium]